MYFKILSILQKIIYINISIILVTLYIITLTPIELERSEKRLWKLMVYK